MLAESCAAAAQQCQYSLPATLVAFVIVTAIGVGIPLYALWKDNR